MRESSTHFKQAMRENNHSKRQFEALNSKNTSCVNTNLPTISHVAQCTLLRKFNKGCTEVVLRHS